MTAPLRTLLLVSPHFPPDSAAGTHRARILAPHLAAFGWHPIVLTVDATAIEGELDPELLEALDGRIDVRRVSAWPATWTRRVGFGDLGLRSYSALRRALNECRRTAPVDAVLVTTYPTYPALLGAALKRTAHVPFVLDLQDPWVGAWGRHVGPRRGAPDLRSRASRALAVHLERHVATAADGLMSVTTRTIEELVERVPSAATTPRLEAPIGWEPADWDRVRGDGQPNGLFDPGDGHLHLCAVGTLLPTALDGVRAFLDGLACVVADAHVRERLRVWFVGTSNDRRANAPALVRPFALERRVDDVVFERPMRMSYFSALRVLRDAHAVLVLGGNEPHYTPSRVFPALASRRPIIARLHRASPAMPLLQAAAMSRPVHLLEWSSDSNAQSAGFASALQQLVQCSRHVAATDDAPLAAFTGAALARQVAAFLDRVCAS